MSLFAIVDQLDHAGVEFAPAVARGFAAALDELAAEHAQDGALGRFGDRAIERACGWTREPGGLVEMLVAAGVLANHAEHRLVLVGWSERAPDAVHAALARARGRFADGTVPRLGPLSGAERKAASAHYAGRNPSATASESAALLARSAESARSEQIAFFFFSSSEGSTREEKREERAREVRALSAEPPRRRLHRAAPPPAAPATAAEPDRLDEEIALARAAAAAYGAVWAEIREGPRRQLAADVVRLAGATAAGVLARCVHGYWSIRGKATETWNPLDHLRPETVWGAKRRLYLDAYDDAEARGLSPPFGRAGPKRARSPSFDVSSARTTLEKRCDELRATCLRAWGDDLRAERERRIFWERGLSAIQSRDQPALDLVLRELAEDAASIESDTVEPMAAGASP